MAKIRAQVQLLHDSGLAEDTVVNTFHFSAPADSTAGNLITDRLATFYQVFDEYLSPALSGTVNVDYYNIDVLPSGPPYFSDTFTITPDTSSPLPAEVALCLSYQAAFVPGLDQRHRRGRVYLGPWSVDAMQGASTSRPHTTLIGLLATAATNFAGGTFADGTPWHIYSSSLATSALVTDGWIDNAWDTQRRRGEDPTSRTTWT